MSTTTLIPKIKITDVSQKKADAFKTTGVITKAEQRPIANGYVSVEITLKYNHPDTGKEDSFIARWNVRPDWFTKQFKDAIEQTRENKKNGAEGPVSEAELTQYDINMSGLTRGLFAAAGLEDIDFDQLPGAIVGFKTKQRKEDPSRLDISYFFKPRN